MKKMKSILMLMAIAAASFTFTSCDDDPWDDGHYWHDDYGWYEDYNQGGWGWNQGDWNQGSNGSQNSQLIEEAQTLVGEWYGPVIYSYINEDGVSRGKDEFYANAGRVTLPKTGYKFSLPLTCSMGLPQTGIDTTGIVPDVTIPLNYPTSLTDNVDEWVYWVAKWLSKD